MTENVPQNQIAKLLDSARQRLVETGTRNRLIHVNRKAIRANTLNIINEKSDDVFEILRVKGRKMKFKATALEKDEEDPDDIHLASQNSADEEFDEARFKDQFLETPLTLDKKMKRLLKLAKDARIAEEEQGVNILYLALGFLKWFEDINSNIEREAPLILLPVELIRNQRTSTYVLRCRDDDIVTNLPLQERLKLDFGIELPEINDSTEWMPNDYFQSVSNSISSQPRWTIDRDGMQLGFFTFSKHLMWRDLDPENWPDGNLKDSELIQKLMEDGFETEIDSIFNNVESLDQVLDPAEVLHVVDTDASQAKVIELVRSGQNLVVQGPPGTGKSQTITNILASAAHDGKTVLFVAEKMAALQVVHKRMVNVDLEDLCLELHSKSANKKSFFQELGRTLSSGRSIPEEPNAPNELREARDELNRLNDLLHGNLNSCDYSPFEVISSIIGFISRDVEPPKLVEPNLANLEKKDVERIGESVAEFAESLAEVGHIPDHPFYGVQNQSLQPPDIQRLGQEIDKGSRAIDELQTELSKLSFLQEEKIIPTLDEIHNQVNLLKFALKAPKNLLSNLQLLSDKLSNKYFIEAINAGATWQKAKANLSEDFVDAAWSYQIIPLRQKIAKGVGSIFSRWFGGYRSASSEFATLLNGPLPESPKNRLELVDKLLSGIKLRSAFLDEEEYLKACLGEYWRGERTDFADLESSLNWLVKAINNSASPNPNVIEQLINLVSSEPQIIDELQKALDNAKTTLSATLKRLELNFESNSKVSEVSLYYLQDRLKSIQSQMHRYREWTQLSFCRKKLQDLNLHSLIGLLENGEVDLDAAEDEFLYATAEARWSKARSLLPDLDKLTAKDRHQLVEEFCALDKSRIADVRKIIKSTHLGKMPRGAHGEMGVIRGEIAKKRQNMPIRRLMLKAGSIIQRIKPIFMMSPISVAQFLPPGRMEFDLLVFDEASQVRPEEALGPIARAKQIVVVGDQKQLPPTSFFDRLASDVEFEEDEEEDDDALPVIRVEEMESILSLCEARGLKSSMLEWHYRSRHPSLITVSNKEFYEDRLILPPSRFKSDDRFGLKFSRVQGVYSSRSRGGGRTGTNRLEAEAVADELARHARNSPELSVGIVTFSKAQADMMSEVLELKRRQDQILDDFMREGISEDLFVKNIENVQGDERDVILISVGYGPHEANGRLSSMNFGPVNSEGGERRLNVLFTRSRFKCEIFASFDPGEIDLSKSKKVGTRVLKRFLEFAKSGILDERLVTGAGADSLFEVDVAKAISQLGYDADLQVGSSGFRIDIAVRHPERAGEYVLAVECDGATYHSALWARERDRLRQEVLEGLGWRFHRIWSTDWFHNRSKEKVRLQKSIERAIASASDICGLKGANQSDEENIDQEETIDTTTEFEFKELKAPEYNTAYISHAHFDDPDTVPINILSGLAVEVVEVEGPVHTEEVARRLAASFGMSRMGSRVKDASLMALEHANRLGDIERKDNFWFTNQQKKSPPVRNRSEENSSTKKPEYLSQMEIRAAAKLITDESGYVEPNELVTAIARLLGYSRPSQKLKTHIKDALE